MRMPSQANSVTLGSKVLLARQALVETEYRSNGHGRIHAVICGIYRDFDSTLQ
jgi:hypothetical protein